MRDVWSYVSKASSEAVAGKTKAVAKLASTKKNRGVRSLPFDENRVVLKWKELSSGANQGVGRGEGDDYINASTVSGSRDHQLKKVDIGLSIISVNPVS